MSITIELPSGVQLPYESNHLIVGTDTACDIVIEHEDVHEQHCRIRKMAGRWIVESMGDWEIRAGHADAGLKSWIQPTDDLYLTPVGPVLIFEPLPHPVGYDPLAKLEKPKPKPKPKQQPKPNAKTTTPPKPASAAHPSAAHPSASPVEVEWLCILNDQGHGPVSQTELQRLAKSGQLKPTDLLWRVGLADWTPATEVPELASLNATTPGWFGTTDSPTSLDRLLPGGAATTPSAHHDSTPTVAQPSFIDSLLGRTDATERLATKQAEFTKLTSVTLIAAYQELGESNFENRLHHDAFHALFSKIQSLDSQLKQITTRSRSDDASAEIDSMIAAANDAAERRKVTHQREQTLVALGQASYEHFGEQAGPAKLVSNITACLTHIESLDRQINKLSASGGGILLTPAHYAAAAIAGILLLILLVIGISLAIAS